MRTNIVLDDELVREAMQYSTARTKRQLIHDALVVYIKQHADKERAELYEERYRQLITRLSEKPFSHSAHNLVREDRDQ